MRGVIYFYSGTGNTALACGYLARGLPLPVDVVDVTTARNVDLAPADVAGFATSTEFWGVPRAFEAFIERLPLQDGTPAFVLNTFGAASGKTLTMLAAAVADRGFDVRAGHSLHMPESYPPMIAARMAARGAPGARQLAHLDAFVSDLGRRLVAAGAGGPAEKQRLRLGLVNSLLPTRSRTTARDGMGEKHVAEVACTECGTCQQGCPYEAIRLEPKPVFDMSRCYGCWRCYNRCPAHAISTGKYRGGPFYPGPSEALRVKLGSPPDATT